MRRRLITAVLLALPLPAVAWASARVADRAGSALASGVAGLSVLLPAPPAELEPEPFPVRQSLVTLDGARAVPEEQATSSRHRYRRRGHIRITHGVHVPARVVLRLAGRGARPRGAYVPSDGVRPGGVRLVGVSALGIGVQDGDVLTRVAGAPAHTAGDVISAVVAARGRLAKAVSGVFWRGHVPYRLVVDQPYVKPKRAAGR